MFQKNVTLRNQWKFKEEKKIWGKKKKRGFGIIIIIIILRQE